MREFAFIDIETSGLEPQYHDVMEVGYQITRGPSGPVIAEREFSLPFNGDKASEEALSINGWGKRKFAGRVSPGQGAAYLREDLQGTIFVANNAVFDAGFLTEFLARQGKRPTWNRRLVNLKDVAAGRLGVAPPINSDRVGEHFGIAPPAVAHTALGDADWNRRVFAALQLWEA